MKYLGFMVSVHVLLNGIFFVASWLVFDCRYADLIAIAILDGCTVLLSLVKGLREQGLDTILAQCTHEDHRIALQCVVRYTQIVLVL